MSSITKEWIATKAKELMKSKPLDKIRVTELCRLAGVERPTFYYHFIDKYDLVAYIFYKDAYDTDVISVESAARGMDKMKENLIFYKRAYEDRSEYALWKYMHEYFFKRYVDVIKKKLKSNQLDPQLEYSVRFYTMGAVGMTREWALNDNVTSSRTIVEMMFFSMPESMKKIVLGS